LFIDDSRTDAKIQTKEVYVFIGVLYKHYVYIDVQIRLSAAHKK